MYIIACNCSSHHFVQNLGIVKCFNAYLYLFLSISYLLFSVRFLNIFIMLISCLSFYEFFSKFSLLCRKQILRFSDPQPQSVLSWKCYLSFIIYKWNLKKIYWWYPCILQSNCKFAHNGYNGINDKINGCIGGLNPFTYV